MGGNILESEKGTEIKLKYLSPDVDWVLDLRQRVCSLFLRSPGNIVGPRGRAVLVHQLLDHLSRVVQLVKVVLEDVFLAELFQEGLALTQLVVLPARPLKQL